MSATVGTDLGYGLYAIALYASDMPTSAPYLTREALAGFAEQGMRELGLDQVEELGRTWDTLNRDLGHALTPKQHRAALARMWPDSQRLECCIAYDLLRLLPPH